MGTYAADEVSLIVGIEPITGLSDGTPLKVEMRTAKWALKKGMQGASGWAKSSDRSATLTFNVIGTSPDNDILSALEASEEEFPVLLKDNSGRSVAFAESCHIEKMPSKDFGALETQDVVWVILMAHCEQFNGGN